MSGESSEKLYTLAQASQEWLRQQCERSQHGPYRAIAIFGAPVYEWWCECGDYRYVPQQAASASSGR